jgi:hypothetical protein
MPNQVNLMHVFIQLLFWTWCYIALFDIFNILTSVGQVYHPCVCEPTLFLSMCTLWLIHGTAFGQMHAFYCSIIFYHRKIEQLIYFCIDGAVDCLDRCYYEHHHLSYERFMHPSVLLGVIWLLLEVIDWLYSYQLCTQSSNIPTPSQGKWQKSIFFNIMSWDYSFFFFKM